MRGGNAYGGNWAETGLIMGVAGGSASALNGSDFERGFNIFAGLSFLESGYQFVVKYDATWESGGDAINKKQLTSPIEGANNIGIQGQGLGDPNNWFDMREGSALSVTANKIPGVNAVAGLHDVFQVKLGTGWARKRFNIPGMFVAAPITYAALLPDQLVYMNAVQNQKSYERSPL